MAIRHADKHAATYGSERIVCASGISPSGAIHVGNLREVMTVHLVADELRRRDLDVEHIHSWDDFDRLRKVPAGVPAGFEEYIGQPLAEIPDPFDEHASYADRFIAEFERATKSLGIEMRAIRQREAYRSGSYRDAIKLAMARRTQIFDRLAAYQTPGRHQEPIEQRRANYYPFQVYCHSCNRDLTKISRYEEDSATVHYECTACGHRHSFSLDAEVPGKLAWKVDWPMRWKHEGVTFEPGGDDHATPGSSFTIGREIVREIFSGIAPCFVQYAFVGVSGMAKMSSSSGGGTTPSSALRVVEPAILRWLYIRRDVRQKFQINLDGELLRVYDEWDKLHKRVTDGNASEKQAWEHNVACQTTSAAISQTPRPVSFRALSSIADIANADTDQIIRIVGDHVDGEEIGKSSLEPRLSCALNWLREHVPPDERTTVRESFHSEAWAALSAAHKESVQRLVELLDDHWSLDGLTKLIYGVPKLQLGLEFDAPPSEAIKTAQRDFFVTLYTLLVDSDTGPRLPTLLLALGRTKIRQLLVPPGPPDR